MTHDDDPLACPRGIWHALLVDAVIAALVLLCVML